MADNSPTGSSGYLDISHLRLQPRWVAWAARQNDEDYGDTYYSVNVRQLRRGARTVTRESGEEGCGETCPAQRGIGPVTQLKLTDTGRIAWIAVATQGTASRPDSSEQVVEVWTASPTRKPQRLAAETNISTTTLSITRERVTWRQAGKLQTAPV